MQNDISKFKILQYGAAQNFSGQVMLLSVLIMGGIMAVAMTVSVTVLGEIRLARQTPDSANAIAAASAGMECAFFQYFVAGNQCGTVCSSPGTFTMGNNARFTATITCGTATTVRSVGVSGVGVGEVRRSLETQLPF